MPKLARCGVGSGCGRCVGMEPAALSRTFYGGKPYPAQAAACRIRLSGIFAISSMLKNCHDMFGLLGCGPDNNGW